MLTKIEKHEHLGILNGHEQKNLTLLRDVAGRQRLLVWWRKGRGRRRGWGLPEVERVDGRLAKGECLEPQISSHPLAPGSHGRGGGAQSRLPL